MLHHYFLTCYGYALLKHPSRSNPVMRRRQLIPVIIKREPGEEDRISERMFADYREENGKDLEREGCGEW